MSEIILEKLLEQRDFYLNTLKQLDSQTITDPSEDELQEIKKLQTTTIEQLKKIEQEIAFISSNS